MPVIVRVAEAGLLIERVPEKSARRLDLRVARIRRQQFQRLIHQVAGRAGCVAQSLGAEAGPAKRRGASGSGRQRHELSPRHRYFLGAEDSVQRPPRPVSRCQRHSCWPQLAAGAGARGPGAAARSAGDRRASRPWCASRSATAPAASPWPPSTRCPCPGRRSRRMT